MLTEIYIIKYIKTSVSLGQSIILKLHLKPHGPSIIQGGPKVGIQYIVYTILYTYFWTTLYYYNTLAADCLLANSNPNKNFMGFSHLFEYNFLVFYVNLSLCYRFCYM